MKVLVCGGRDFDDLEAVFDALEALNARHQISHVIHGAAEGADKLAGMWANPRSDVEELRFPADWQAHGKAAGPIRNQRMLDEGRPDLVLAFPGGRGTADMVRRAKAAGVRVWAPGGRGDR